VKAIYTTIYQLRRRFIVQDEHLIRSGGARIGEWVAEGIKCVCALDSEKKRLGRPAVDHMKVDPVAGFLPEQAHLNPISRSRVQLSFVRQFKVALHRSAPLLVVSVEESVGDAACSLLASR
jgi:hypothetical protein